MCRKYLLQTGRLVAGFLCLQFSFSRKLFQQLSLAGMLIFLAACGGGGGSDGGGGGTTPFANDDSRSTDQTTTINIAVLANDTGLDDAPLTVKVVQAPTGGSTTVEANNTITYVPNGTFVGTDTFTYSVTDIDDDMATAVVNLTVNSNTGGGTTTPFANDDSRSTDQTTTINIAVLANDTGLDDAPLTVKIVQAPTGGSTTVEANNTITYVPNGTFVGTDTFTYSVTDIDDDLATATVNLTVSSSLSLEVSTTVPNTYEWGTLTTGSVVYIDRSYTYSDIPSSYLGMQYLRTANDDKTSSGNTFLSFTVNKTVDVYVGHANVENNRPSWLDTWTWTNDTLVTTDRTLYLYKKIFSAGTVSLSGNENGGNSSSMYVVLVDDNSNNSVGGIATPSANSDSASTNQATPINIAVLANDAGLDDAPLTIKIVQAPTGGSTTIETNNTITYTPDDTFVGTDTFTYSVTDIDGDMATAAVNLTVGSGTGGGAATPIANDDSSSTDQTTAINIDVLTNDTGLDDTPLTVNIVQAPAVGSTIVEANNTITYTPNGTFVGEDMFTYSVTDTDGDMAIATVNLTVNCMICAAGVNVTFSWDPNPTTDFVLGYRVYTGSTLATATMEVSNLTVGSNGFDATAPSLNYDAWNDLGLEKGDTVCFRLKAYNSVGSSDFSTGICGDIPN